MVSPGVRQQLVRVLGELVSNMTKYAAPGPARLVIEADGLSLEGMATNAVAPPDGTSDLPAPSASSGLGWRGPGAGWSPWAGPSAPLAAPSASR